MVIPTQVLHLPLLGDLVVYLYFNEPVAVVGDCTILLLKQATAVGTDFCNIESFIVEAYLIYDAGIVAFELAASVDTQTSAVTNNTLGIGSGLMLGQKILARIMKL